MKLIMTGTDYKHSAVEDREKLAFTSSEAVEFCNKMCNIDGVTGCVVLSTCNRTEVYICCNTDLELENYIFDFKGIKAYNGKLYSYYGNELVRYIMELAAGLRSQILGEGQIVTQLNNAVTLSRNAGCTDAYIDTLFRIAVSAGKYALTHCSITPITLSSAYAAAELLTRHYGSLEGRKGVVIGNGKVGSLMQSVLIKKGCNVYATLRTYGKNLPFGTVRGTTPIAYDDRYKYIDGCDFVVSATKSQHFTLTLDKMSQLKKQPEIVVDLAVPRDVEPSIAGLCKCVNIDELGYKIKIDKNELLRLKTVVEKFSMDYIKWQNYKLSLPTIENIKSVITQRIIKSSEVDSCDVSQVVTAAVDMLLGSMKESVAPDIMEASERKIEERARL